MFSLFPNRDISLKSTSTVSSLKAAIAVASVIYVSKSLLTLLYDKSMWSKKKFKSQVIDIRPYCLQCKKGKMKHRQLCRHDSLEPLYEILNSAKRTIDVSMYIFTDQKILKILLDAKERQVNIRLITDPEMAFATKSCINALHDAGVPIKWKRSVHSMHHKCCIIDEEVVLTGSFNWTEQATNGNYENLLILRNGEGVRQFVSMFNHLWNTFDVFNIPQSTQQNS